MSRDPFGNTTVVLPTDPALDLSDAEREQYVASAWDASLLRFLPGLVPTVFHLRRLTPAELAEAGFEPGVGALAAFSFAVFKVTGTSPSRPARGEPPWEWSERACDLYGFDAVTHVGAAAFVLSHLSPSTQAPLLLAAWEPSEGIVRAMRPALCGCRIRLEAKDPRDAEHMLGLAEEHRKAWRCPGLNADPLPASAEGLGKWQSEGLKTVEERTGARCTTCPFAYTHFPRFPWLARALSAYRMRDSPRLSLAEPRLSQALLQAVAALEAAEAARESYEDKRRDAERARQEST